MNLKENPTERKKNAVLLAQIRSKSSSPDRARSQNREGRRSTLESHASSSERPTPLCLHNAKGTTIITAHKLPIVSPPPSQIKNMDLTVDDTQKMLEKYTSDKSFQKYGHNSAMGGAIGANLITQNVSSLRSRMGGIISNLAAGVSQWGTTPVPVAANSDLSMNKPYENL